MTKDCCFGSGDGNFRKSLRPKAFVKTLEYTNSMRSFRVSTDGCGLKGSAQLNHHSCDEHKEVREGAVGEGQGLSEEDESRINEVSQKFTGGREGAPPVWAALQEQQQQPQGQAVHWERFLPLRSLKVLLVENDDSTRHVVSALLRNCSYEVAAASNGLQGWKILEDLNNHIDLVLTEVVMPCLSGFGLLCKIMNHKTLKNIPVIMMSSHDSMGIVFKCLSKGAVDFLVKPIRKNELKNLWQHVWRRCHSSSGSGSESGIQTQKCAKSKSVDDSDNNTGSNDGDDNESIGFNNRDGSDNGSGTQTSWTKQAVEVDSPLPMSLYNQFTDPPDSTCAQVVYPKPVTFCNEWVPMTSKLECKGHKEQPSDNVTMGKDLEIGVPTNPDLLLKSYPSEKISTNQEGSKRDNGQANKVLVELDTSNTSGELTAQAADLIGVIAQSQIETGIVANTPYSISKTSEIKDTTISEAKDLPFLELSLKRLRSVGDNGTVACDERNVLKRSDLSAFSRYNIAPAPTQTPTGDGGSNSPVDNKPESEAVKTESLHNLPSKSKDTPLKQGSNGSSNNNDMGSTTKNVSFKSEIKDKSTSASKCLNPLAFQLVQFYQTCPQQIVPKKSEDLGATMGQPRGVQHPTLVHHHPHHHNHNIQQQQKQQPPLDLDEQSMKNMAAAAPQCRSSNVIGGTADGNTMNYSLNGSVSGSNHGSNGQNGSSTGVNAGGMNMESDNGVVGKSRGGSGSRSGSGSGVEQNRFAQREAALTKFRQKRKERCFQKKVRYQSRKRLAEQRPRVRGQFVRQIVYEYTSQEDDS